MLGATFYNLPPTADGGFTRGSIIFVGKSILCLVLMMLNVLFTPAMLVVCLDAFGEVCTISLLHVVHPVLTLFV